jgi:hypothetical protein
MLAASTFVLIAASSTGSLKPWDWSRADPSAAGGRYQLCGQQGLGAIGCMLSSAFRPASAVPGAAAPAGSHRAQQPLYSVATVQDMPPATTSGSSQATAAAPSHGSASGSHSGTSGGWQHMVRLPAHASTSDVVVACQAAMKTAQTQGAAAMTEVEKECEADLAPTCPAAARATQTPSTAQLQELETECTAPAPQEPAGHDE